MYVKKDKKVTAIILAAGAGIRMKSDVTKQRISILGKSVLLRSVEAHVRCRLIDDITVVCRPDETDFVRDELAFIDDKPITVVTGGETRFESACLGFNSIPDDVDYVSIHDAARCLVTSQMIEKVVFAAFEYGAATAATPMTDTVKLVDSDKKIKTTVPRENLWAASTPQVFSTELYRRAMLKHKDSDGLPTDDNMLLEKIGISPVCIDVGKENIKITTSEDLLLAEFLIRRNNGEL